MAAPLRSEIDDEYKWAVNDIYSSDEAWNTDYEKIMNMAKEPCKYAGGIAESYEKLYQVLKEKKIVSERQYNTAVKRMIRHSDFSERMIMPDGVFPAFGRSATYRTGAFQSLSQVALMKILPSYIHPAQVRCALTAVFVNMYDGNQNFDKNGWLVLGFNGHQPELADYYTTTGSLYMATLGFLALGLPADDYFWTNSFEEWTSCKIWSGKPSRKDYKVEY